MSDAPAVMAQIAGEIQTVLESHLDELVEAERDECDVWEMPTLADFICVVGVQDVGDGLGATYLVHAKGPWYRRVGLLNHALMALQSDLSR